jgi:vitamin B12 transporter
VETEVELYPRQNWRATASYTVVEPRVTDIDPGYEGSDRPGDALLRRPTHSGTATISYGRPGGLSAGTAISYVGQRPDVDFSQFPSPRVALPAYTKVDLSAEFPVTHRGAAGLSLTGRIENVFDKRYEDVLNFEAPGRTILLGARATGMF